MARTEMTVRSKSFRHQNTDHHLAGTHYSELNSTLSRGHLAINFEFIVQNKTTVDKVMFPQSSSVRAVRILSK